MGDVLYRCRECGDGQLRGDLCDLDEYEPSRQQLLMTAPSGVIALFALSRLKAVFCRHSLSNSYTSQPITIG